MYQDQRNSLRYEMGRDLRCGKCERKIKHSKMGLGVSVFGMREKFSRFVCIVSQHFFFPASRLFLPLRYYRPPTMICRARRLNTTKQWLYSCFCNSFPHPVFAKCRSSESHRYHCWRFKAPSNEPNQAVRWNDAANEI